MGGMDRISAVVYPCGSDEDLKRVVRQGVFRWPKALVEEARHVKSHFPMFVLVEESRMLWGIYKATHDAKEVASGGGQSTKQHCMEVAFTEGHKCHPLSEAVYKAVLANKDGDIQRILTLKQRDSLWSLFRLVDEKSCKAKAKHEVRTPLAKGTTNASGNQGATRQGTPREISNLPERNPPTKQSVKTPKTMNTPKVESTHPSGGVLRHQSNFVGHRDFPVGVQPFLGIAQPAGIGYYKFNLHPSSVCPGSQQDRYFLWDGRGWIPRPTMLNKSGWHSDYWARFPSKDAMQNRYSKNLLHNISRPYSPEPCMKPVTHEQDKNHEERKKFREEREKLRFEVEFLQKSLKKLKAENKMNLRRLQSEQEETRIWEEALTKAARQHDELDREIDLLRSCKAEVPAFNQGVHRIPSMDMSLISQCEAQQTAAIQPSPAHSPLASRMQSPGLLSMGTTPRNQSPTPHGLSPGRPGLSRSPTMFASMGSWGPPRVPQDGGMEGIQALNQKRVPQINASPRVACTQPWGNQGFQTHPANQGTTESCHSPVSTPMGNPPMPSVVGNQSVPQPTNNPWQSSSMQDCLSTIGTSPPKSTAAISPVFNTNCSTTHRASTPLPPPSPTSFQGQLRPQQHESHHQAAVSSTVVQSPGGQGVSEQHAAYHNSGHQNPPQSSHHAPQQAWHQPGINNSQGSFLLSPRTSLSPVPNMVPLNAPSQTIPSPSPSRSPSPSPAQVQGSDYRLFGMPCRRPPTDTPPQPKQEPVQQQRGWGVAPSATRIADTSGGAVQRETHSFGSAPSNKESPTSGGNASSDGMYILGGSVHGENVDLVERYHSNGMWEPMGTLPKGFNPRHGVACAINENIFILGLQKQHNPADVGTVHRCNTLHPGFNASPDGLQSDEGIWDQMASLKTPRVNLSCTSCNGKLIAVGGQRPGFQEACDIVEVYDPERNIWTQAPHMNQSRFGFDAVCVASCVFAVGGQQNKNTPLDSVEFWDMRKKGWQTVRSMEFKRGYLSCAVYGEAIFALGGCGVKQNHLPIDQRLEMQATVETLDPRANKWTTNSPLSETRAFGGAEHWDGYIWAIGGRKTVHDIDSMLAMERFDIREGKWKSGLLAGSRHKRAYHMTCVVQTN